MAWIIIGVVLIALIVGYGLYQQKQLSKQYQQSQQKKQVTVFDLEPEIVGQKTETTYQQRKVRQLLLIRALIAIVIVVCGGGFAISTNWNKMVEKRAAEQGQEMMAEKQTDQQLPAKSVETGVKWASENGKFNWFSKSAALYRFKLAQRQDREQAEQKIQELKAKRDALNVEWQQISLKGDANIQSFNQELYQANLKDLNAQIDELYVGKKTAMSSEPRHMSFAEWQMVYSWKNAILAMILLCLWKFWAVYVRKDGDIIFSGWDWGCVVLGLLVVDILLCRFIDKIYLLGVVVGSLFVMGLGVVLSMSAGWLSEKLRERYLNKVYDNQKLSVIIRQPLTIIALVVTVLIIWGTWELLY